HAFNCLNSNSDHNKRNSLPLSTAQPRVSKSSNSLKFRYLYQKQLITIFQNDRDVEMSVCLRATQRLTEYEAMLVDLSHRWSNALIHNDVEQADRIRVAMADCRDTVLRAIHVDLLLGRNEVRLRAIGVNSNWAPHE
ncbi:unnamed protein product, partial [Heligmosomoides polygyrus]|uniref:Rubis-subs-bind domain-containing protein n=1 Tax=Heligmosomoides polygyrus TaxID=6339 RepID=A0A183F2Y2_HELPZ